MKKPTKREIEKLAKTLFLAAWVDNNVVKRADALRAWRLVGRTWGCYHRLAEYVFTHYRKVEKAKPKPHFASCKIVNGKAVCE